MGTLGTSFSYTSNLYGTIEARTETPLRFVNGMPRRAVYAADQGWDELFQVRAMEPVIRRGATAQDTAVAKRATPAERAPEESNSRHPST